MKVRAFEELGPLLEQVRREQARLAREQAQHAAERARQQREAAVFALAVGPVQALKSRHAHRALLERPLPDPLPLQRIQDEQQALREALSDEVDVESLLLTDDGLSYRRPHIGIDVLHRLRKGQWAIQGELDLHGLRREEARDALAAFIRHCHQASHRCLRVVHGKGHGSPGREPVLKSKVHRWLAQRQEVMAFTQAPGAQGGAGALIVLLTSRLSPAQQARQVNAEPHSGARAAASLAAKLRTSR
jgi:DNA-nicking Smr family endonuclease